MSNVQSKELVHFPAKLVLRGCNRANIELPRRLLNGVQNGCLTIADWPRAKRNVGTGETGSSRFYEKFLWEMSHARWSGQRTLSIPVGAPSGCRHPRPLQPWTEQARYGVARQVYQYTWSTLDRMTYLLHLWLHTRTRASEQIVVCHCNKWMISIACDYNEVQLRPLLDFLGGMDIIHFVTIDKCRHCLCEQK